MVCIVNKKVDIMEDHVKFMKTALALAERAARGEDVPVGAVIVKDGKIIGRGKNFRENGNDATAHAEIVAIRDACKQLGNRHLDDCDIYITLEPCPMCAGAIINARLKRVIFGGFDKKAGSASNDSVIDLFSLNYNHKPEVYCGIMEKECTTPLIRFFKDKR